MARPILDEQQLRYLVAKHNANDPLPVSADCVLGSVQVLLDELDLARRALVVATLKDAK